MRTKAIGFAITALLASAASGQPPAEQHRVFRLVHADAIQDVQEIATVIRAMTSVQLSTDTSQKTLAARGTASQMALAEWLVGKLDKPAVGESPLPQSRDSATYDYTASGSSENVVRVFYLKHAGTPQRLQEIATVVRSTAGVRQLFIYHALRAMSLRGTADQIGRAERLVDEHDKP